MYENRIEKLNICKIYDFMKLFWVIG